MLVPVVQLPLHLVSLTLRSTSSAHSPYQLLFVDSNAAEQRLTQPVHTHLISPRHSMLATTALHSCHRHASIAQKHHRERRASSKGMPTTQRTTGNTNTAQTAAATLTHTSSPNHCPHQHTLSQPCPHFSHYCNAINKHTNSPLVHRNTLLNVPHNTTPLRPNTHASDQHVLSSALSQWCSVIG